jgi:hypothetical protein
MLNEFLLIIYADFGNYKCFILINTIIEESLNRNEFLIESIYYIC